MSLQTAVAELSSLVGKLPAKDQDFARSLVAQYTRRGLSDKQAVWVQRLIDRTKASVTAPVQVDLSRISTMLNKAGEHLKYPAILVLVNGKSMRLHVAGNRSSAPGSISVVDPGEDKVWYGRVHTDGRFEASRRLDGDTQTAIGNALSALASDPEKAAAEYGRLTGICCFCRNPLGRGEDRRSVEVGYGPTCAKHYGLSWGAKASQ